MNTSKWRLRSITSFSEGKKDTAADILNTVATKETATSLTKSMGGVVGEGGRERRGEERRGEMRRIGRQLGK